MLDTVPLFSSRLANEGVDLIGALRRVVERSWFVLGDEVLGFEREFADYLGVKHCISVANGTDALEIALRSLAIGPGSRVALVANAGFYGSTAVRALGAQPVYVEIDSNTLGMSPPALEVTLSEGVVDAVIVTHLYGQLAEIERLLEICRSARIPLIEDCAQAHGARRDGRLAGSFGDLSCFSYYPTKNLGGIGDGGAVVTNDSRMDALARRLRQYGWSGKYYVTEAGGRNSRLDEIQAAVLRSKLPFLDAWNATRRQIARRYNEAFAGLPLRLPVSVGDDYVAHLYVLRMEERSGFMAAMRDAGISTDVHYPIADHLQQVCAGIGVHTLPVTEEACNSVVSLPCFPGLDTASVNRVIESVKTYFSSRY